MVSLMLLTVSPMKRYIFSLLSGTLGAPLIVGLLESVVAGYSVSRHLPQAGFLSSIPPPPASVSHNFPKDPL